MHVLSQKLIRDIVKKLTAHDSGHIALVGKDADRYLQAVESQEPRIFRQSVIIRTDIDTQTLRKLQTSTVWGVRTCIIFKDYKTVPRWLIDAIGSRVCLPPCIFVQLHTCSTILQRVVQVFHCGRKDSHIYQLVRTKKLQRARDMGGTHATHTYLHHAHSDMTLSEHLSIINMMTNKVPGPLVEHLEDICIRNATMLTTSFVSYPNVNRGRELLQHIQPSASKILGRLVSVSEIRQRAEVEFDTNRGHSTLYMDIHQKSSVQQEVNRQVALVTRFQNPICKKRKVTA